MKNLKKVLALVLVVATLMSFATVASATFTDASDIEYTEAVDVMEMIGVINGYTDGSFMPNDTVSRAEMAKMVTLVIAGGEDVGDLYAAANTFSDCTTNWAKGYIAYANKTGIVAGVGGGKFNPTGDVTGTQAAKMMLCALGYDAGIEEYTGTNWAVNVLSDAKSAGLLDGLSSVDMSKAMTREQAAQLMFNALKADMVRYDNKGTTVDLGNGVTFVTGASDAEPTGDLMREEYFPNLKENASQNDDFGRPGHTWSYKVNGKTETVGSYAEEAGDVIVADEAITGNYASLTAFLQEKLDNDSLSNSGATYYFNGVADTGATNMKADTGAGTILEVFYDDDNSNLITRVVAYQYVLDKIDEVDTDVSDADAKDGVSAYVTFEAAGTFNDTDIAGFNAKTYVEGTYVAIVEKGTSVIASFIPEAVTGYATAKNTSDNNVTVDGTKYTFASNSAEDASDITLGSDNEFTMYLDQNGYVMGAPAVSAIADSIDTVYVTYVYNTTNAWNEPVTMFQGVLADGTVVNAEYTYAGTLTDVNKAYAYEMDGDVYELSFIGSAYGTQVGVLGLGNSFSIDKDDVRLDATLSGHVIKNYFNSGVKFVYISGDKDDLKVTVKEGVQTLDTDNGDYAVISKNSDGLYVVDTVFVNAVATTSNDDLIYVAANTSYNGTVLGNDGKTYYSYEVFLNGEKTTIYKSSNSDITAGFHAYSVDDESGAYTLSAPGGNVDTVVSTNLTYVNGTYYLTVGGKDYVADDAVVADTDSDRSPAINTLARLNKNKSASINLDVITDGESNITYIYVK